jgi:hypothetical protein
VVSKLITTSAKIVSYLNSHYTGRTWLFREVRSLVASSEDGLQARVCQTFLGAVDCGRRRIANSHTKALSPVRNLFENRMTVFLTGGKALTGFPRSELLKSF